MRKGQWYCVICFFYFVSVILFCRREPAPPKVVTLLVEEYLSFMHSRPGFMLQVFWRNYLVNDFIYPCFNKWVFMIYFF